MAGRLKHTMVVRNPETLEATALLEGSKLPEWATDLVDKGNLVDKADKSEKSDKDDKSDKAKKSEGSGSTGGTNEGKGYAGQSPDELKAEAEKRELTVTGTGANGNVLKGDLVKALEADDASKAS